MNVWPAVQLWTIVFRRGVRPVVTNDIGYLSSGGNSQEYEAKTGPWVARVNLIIKAMAELGDAVIQSAH